MIFHYLYDSYGMDSIEMTSGSVRISIVVINRPKEFEKVKWKAWSIPPQHLHIRAMLF